MNIFQWIFIIVIMGSISSCCTKKDCDQDYYPQIVVKYNPGSGGDLKEKMIYVLSKETHKRIDSIEISDSYNYFVIDKWLMYTLFGDKREFKQYDYLLKTEDRKDSLTNIQYNRTSEKIDCNDCFPVGDGSATVTNFEHLKFTINQKLYVGTDTVRMD